jgi:hypothetical protein
MMIRKRNNLIGISSLDELIKSANAEVLLNHMKISNKNETVVIPVRCPAVGRKEDYGKDDKGNPACIFLGKPCKYFLDATFNLEEYEKNIKCAVS